MSGNGKLNPEVRKFTEDVMAMFKTLDVQRHLSLGEASFRLDCSPKFLRNHLDFFQKAWKFPGKSGEIRIPVQDIEDNAERFRMFHAKKMKKQNPVTA